MAFLTIDQLAAELQVSRSTIHRLVHAGLPRQKVGRSVRFRMDRVVAYLDKVSSGRRALVSRGGRP